MSTKNTPWWIALFVWMGLSTYWHVCQIKELCDAPMLPPAEVSHINPLNIKDGVELNLLSKGNFAFLNSGADPGIALVTPELDSLVSYLSLNPSKRLNIVGYYTATETNTTSYPDLGIARAEAVKRLLVSKGLAESTITTSSKRIDSMTMHGDSLYGGIDFLFSRVVLDTEEKLADAEKYESVFVPMDLYFPSGKSEYIKTDENEQFMVDAQKFLSENVNKKLLLTGHTDSDGDEARNMILARNRAEKVRKQLMKKGINASQLLIDAKGEAEPKESNDTPEGKRANRRVTIVVQ